MKTTWPSFILMVVVLAAAGATAAYWVIHKGGPQKNDSQKVIAPASQTKTVNEAELNIISLTAEAEQRLGIQTTKVAIRKIQSSRLLGGEVFLPPGKLIVASAPFAGQIRIASSEAITPGQVVKKGQVVFALTPLLSAEARTSLITALVDAEGQIKNAEIQIRAASIAFARAKQLVAESAGSKRAVDEAQTALELAQKTYDAAVARRDLLSKTIKGGESGSVAAINIESPESGIVRNISAANGQLVSAGMPLFEVANLEKLWVRVPVYVGALGTVDINQAASIGKSVKAGIDQSVSAKPIAAPPSASALSATRDLFYEIDNAKSDWSPGQRVWVNLPMKGETESMIVPWSAVVHDVAGSAWVYENIGMHKYTRRRVQVQKVVDVGAVLAGGPSVGTVIVSQGVAELFGKEMGFGK